MIKRQFTQMAKYSDIFDEKSREYGVDKDLLISIAILENLNRPVWVRFFEKLSQRKRKKVFTVGLMQISSVAPLSDEQSIDKAAKILSEFDTRDIVKIGKLYNGSAEYGKCLGYVVSQVKMF